MHGLRAILGISAAILASIPHISVASPPPKTEVVPYVPDDTPVLQPFAIYDLGKNALGIGWSPDGSRIGVYVGMGDHVVVFPVQSDGLPSGSGPRYINLTDLEDVKIHASGQGIYLASTVAFVGNHTVALPAGSTPTAINLWNFLSGSERELPSPFSDSDKEHRKRPILNIVSSFDGKTLAATVSNAQSAIPSPIWIEQTHGNSFFELLDFGKNKFGLTNSPNSFCFSGSGDVLFANIPLSKIDMVNLSDNSHYTTEDLILHNIIGMKIACSPYDKSVMIAAGSAIVANGPSVGTILKEDGSHIILGSDHSGFSVIEISKKHFVAAMTTLNTVKLFSSDTGKYIAHAVFPGQLSGNLEFSLGWSPSGRILAVTVGSNVELFDLYPFLGRI